MSFLTVYLALLPFGRLALIVRSIAGLNELYEHDDVRVKEGTVYPTAT